MTPEQKQIDAWVWRDARFTTLWVSIATLLCLVIAWMSGRISADRPIDVAKALSAAGAVLAGWGTYFMLHGAYTLWDEPRPDERLRTMLFKATFVPGLFCAVLGAVL